MAATGIHPYTAGTLAEHRNPSTRLGVVLLLPLFSSSFGGLRAERLPIVLFNAYNGATREHCDLPIYSDWEKFNSAAYKHAVCHH